MGNSPELSTYPQADFFEKLHFRFAFPSDRSRMFPFEFRRRQIAQRGMQPLRVVEPLEIVEDHRPAMLLQSLWITGRPPQLCVSAFLCYHRLIDIALKIILVSLRIKLIPRVSLAFDCITLAFLTGSATPRTTGNGSDDPDI